MTNKILLFGINFEIVNLKDCADLIEAADKTLPKYICLPDMYTVSCAYEDELLLAILNNSFLTLPDGKPIQLIGFLKGIRHIQTISGYWLLMQLLNKNVTHYFYGGDSITLGKMEKTFQRKYPEAKILGFKAPPMLTLHDIQNNPVVEADMEEIRKLQPDIVWLGISSPKQDYLAYYYHNSINHGIMIAIGGVFDYLADKRRKSPEWMKKIGVRWLYRLVQEPKRLGPKYFFTLKTLILLVFKKLSSSKLHQ